MAPYATGCACCRALSWTYLSHILRSVFRGLHIGGLPEQHAYCAEAAQDQKAYQGEDPGAWMSRTNLQTQTGPSLSCLSAECAHAWRPLPAGTRTVDTLSDGLSALRTCPCLAWHHLAAFHFFGVHSSLLIHRNNGISSCGRSLEPHLVQSPGDFCTPLAQGRQPLLCIAGHGYSHARTLTGPACSLGAADGGRQRG